MEKLSAEELGVDLTPRLETLKVAEPPKRVGGGKVCRMLTTEFTAAIFLIPSYRNRSKLSTSSLLNSQKQA